MFKKLLLGLFMIFAFANIAQAESTYTLYYFHGNMRCATCRNFERMTAELAPILPVEFKIVNTDEKDNMHYLSDYSLYSNAVVIASSKGNFKNLDKIWKIGRNQAEFKTYITDEVNQFVRENP